MTGSTKVRLGITRPGASKTANLTLISIIFQLINMVLHVLKLFDFDNKNYICIKEGNVPNLHLIGLMISHLSISSLITSL